MRWRWLLLALGLLVAGFAWLALTPPPAGRQGPLVVTIPPHHGLLGIADRLAQAQVIRSRPAFVVATLLRGTPRSLKAREYAIPREAQAGDPRPRARAGTQRAPAPDARLDHRARGHREGRAAPHLGGLLEPAEDRDAAPGGPDRPVRGGQGTAGAEPRGPRHRPPVQHLRACRAAAGADRQSGARGDPRRARSGAREVSLLRRARRPPPSLLLDGGRGPRRRRALPPVAPSVAPLAGGRTPPETLL